MRIKLEHSFVIAAALLSAPALSHADDVYLIDLGRVRAQGPVRDFPLDRVSALIKECLLG